MIDLVVDMDDMDGANGAAATSAGARTPSAA